jgi:hypothetical protein
VQCRSEQSHSWALLAKKCRQSVQDASLAAVCRRTQVADLLCREGDQVGLKHVATLMKKVGIQAR